MLNMVLVASLSKSIVNCYDWINEPSPSSLPVDCTDNVCLHDMEVLTWGFSDKFPQLY